MKEAKMNHIKDLSMTQWNLGVAADFKYTSSIGAVLQSFNQELIKHSDNLKSQTENSAGSLHLREDDLLPCLLLRFSLSEEASNVTAVAAKCRRRRFFISCFLRRY
ncbi:unnamed protein product [Hermetia illucens]|uniref:Uncharacterized protein n=1 Tax=Hermetia illucens TaxID=343691 RepID=A0A7R8UFR4_HERIL|nr:unnamed protein product [Hermetia illucens]